MSTTKKTILITGAAGNLGKAVVEKFLAEGHRVIAVDSPGRAVKTDVAGDLVVQEADLLEEKSVEGLIDSLSVKYDYLNAAVLLVGGYGPGNIFDTDGAALKKMYSLNFETAYFVARPVFSRMAKQDSGGRIVLVGARTALRPKDAKGSLAYALSKSLIFKLADFLNAEGADKDVITSVIVPSTIDTPANRSSMPKADFSKWVKPEAIAEVLSFITSDKSEPLRETVLKIYGKA